jgi:hypothetical protein
MKLAFYLASICIALATTGCSAAQNQLADTSSSQIAGKPGAAVEVELKSGDKTTNGAILPLQLEFKTGHPNATLEVEYRVEGALSLLGASHSQLVTDANGIATDTPSVRALADGSYYLNVFVRLDNRGRAISIPITVGTAQPPLKRAGKAATTPQGENLIILPAKERKH